MAIKVRVLVLVLRLRLMPALLNLRRALVTVRLLLPPKMRQPVPLQLLLLLLQRLKQPRQLPRHLRQPPPALADHTYSRLLHGAFS